MQEPPKILRMGLLIPRAVNHLGISHFHHRAQGGIHGEIPFVIAFLWGRLAEREQFPLSRCQVNWLSLDLSPELIRHKLWMLNKYQGGTLYDHVHMLTKQVSLHMCHIKSDFLKGLWPIMHSTNKMSRGRL
uniref:Uncharacterized protein n=1 Tax=Sphaerodactylus townsendi TaxID=933632 RepID=A0ACB8EYF8_9SAUR